MQNIIGKEKVTSYYVGGLIGDMPKVESKTYIKEKTKKPNNNFVENITMTLKNASNFEECADKIADLKTGRFNDLLKIASILYAFQNSLSESDSKNFAELLKDKRVKLNKSQGYKYVEVYKFCIDKKEIFQSAGKIHELGIEKIYLISKLNNKNQQNDLINHLSEEKLSVTQLKYVIEILNQNIVSDVNCAYESLKSAIEKKRLNEELLKLNVIKPKAKTNYDDVINRLRQEIELLKTKLAQYENSKIT